MRGRTRTGVAAGIALVVTMALAGCGGDEGVTAATTGTTLERPEPTQSTLPPVAPGVASGDVSEFHGTVQKVTPGGSGDVLGWVQLGGGGDEIVLTVTEDTRLTQCGPTDGPVPLPFDEIAASPYAEGYATVTGPVAESYPLQAEATSLHIGICG